MLFRYEDMRVREALARRNLSLEQKCYRALRDNYFIQPVYAEIDGQSTARNGSAAGAAVGEPIKTKYQLELAILNLASAVDYLAVDEDGNAFKVSELYETNPPQVYNQRAYGDIEQLVSTHENMTRREA